MIFSSTFLGKATPLILLSTMCALFTSCGGSNITKSISKPYHAIADMIPRRVPVTTVRPEDLKNMPTGADRARAWDRQLDAKRYAFGFWSAPKHYKAPKLPDSRSLPSGGGILPPLHRGQDSGPEGNVGLSAD